MIEPKVFSVGQINRYIKNLLENDFILNSLLVQGEISNFKAHSSGHWYFTLKDAQGAIACVMFQQDAAQVPFLPENGMQVILYGHVSLYERTGQYQLYGEFLEPVGMGALQLAFEQMKEKLAAEGLFDADYKREIPENIGCIAVITSPTGAAVRDIIQIAKRRDPRVKLAIFPTLVQGEAAAADIVRSLKLANSWGKADVIILGRGGGSMEDLWAFNEEVTARAIFASEIPVISAVGHEPDFTIADFVADLRAPTPSGAAELAVPDRAEYALNLRTLDARLHTAAHRRAEQQRKLLDGLQERLSNRTPMKYIEEKRLLLTQTEERLFSAVPVRLETERNRLNGLKQRLLAAGQSGLHRRKLRFAQTVATLDAMSPLRVLGRGYAVATKGVKHTVVTDAAALKQGDTLHIQFAKGAADCRVTDIEEDK